VTEDIFEALSNPIRRKILILLNEKPMSYKELAAKLKISIGSLYYHLSYLKPLISQDELKRYSLNERGREVVNELIREYTIPKTPSHVLSLINVITLNFIITYAISHSSIPSSLFIILVLLQVWMLSTTHTSILLTIPYTNIPYLSIIVLHYVITLAIIIVVSLVLMGILHRKVNYINLVFMLPLSTIPLSLYPALVVCFGIPDGIKEILYFLFNLWFIGIYSRIMKNLAEVKYTYSALVCLLICYFSLILMIM